MFHRKNLYYLFFSDPKCGYCIRGTSYITAFSPLGPWTKNAVKISRDSCGGQPAAVSELPGPKGSVFVYQSHQWHNMDAHLTERITTNQSVASQFRGMLR